MRKNDLGDVVVLDADTNTVETPFQDLASLPTDVVRSQCTFEQLSLTNILTYSLNHVHMVARMYCGNIINRVKFLSAPELMVVISCVSVLALRPKSSNIRIENDDSQKTKAHMLASFPCHLQLVATTFCPY